MIYDVIVVGGGIAGLTSASYVARSGKKVLLIEKADKVGGLVNSFKYKDFVFDGGIRAIENSGIVFPMLRDLGIDMEFVKNTISIGIEDNVMKVETKESLKDYEKLLKDTFPNRVRDIDKIMKEIKTIMKHMDILYGVDNPLFLNLKNNREYFLKTILPWLFKFPLTINKILKLNEPVDQYLNKLTSDKALIDIIGQHFFKKTPAFFALSYFSLYLEYKYPKGGTGQLPEKMKEFIENNHGDIKLETEVCSINIDDKNLIDTKGNKYGYEKLIWAGDMRSLYNIVNIDKIKKENIKSKVLAKKKQLIDKTGRDSILTVYITTELDKSYFESICTEHFFYTPSKAGLSTAGKYNINDYKKEEIKAWLGEFYNFNTYEIAIPAMRDETLAPKGKTGLIISTLIDYELVKRISDENWYEEFKKISKQHIINILNNSIFPSLKNSVTDTFVSTPLTIERITNNYQGSITGWAFTNGEIPVVDKLTKVGKSIYTEIPDVYQVGQWAFSPAGFPTSILTGKLAADHIVKN